MNINETLTKNHKAILETILNVLTVLISVCGVNLLFSVVIEVNSKNALIDEINANDVISSPEFYNLLSKTKKNNMYNALERSLFFKYDITHNMYQNIRYKLINNINDYYFCKCDYVVSCSIYDTYIEKEITRKISLKSYEDTYVIRDYNFVKFSSKTISGMKPCEVKSVEINNEKIEAPDYTIDTTGNRMNNLDEQNQYDSYIKYTYKKPLKINSKDETVVCVKYITRTSIDDRMSTFRVGKPCQNFSLIYSIKQHNKYRIAVDAFGFLDNADDSANNTSDSDVNICFPDWIFRYDGVTVVILDK